MVKEADFFRSVKVGDEDAVRAMLQVQPNLIHARDREGSTPLHMAAWKGQAGIVDLLLDAGADIQAHNDNHHWGTTPLHAAAHGNQKAVAEVLIRRGAEVNALKANGEGRPLGETKVHRATAVAKLLIAAGAVE